MYKWIPVYYAVGPLVIQSIQCIGTCPDRKHPKVKGCCESKERSADCICCKDSLALPSYLVYSRSHRHGNWYGLGVAGPESRWPNHPPAYGPETHTTFQTLAILSKILNCQWLPCRRWISMVEFWSLLRFQTNATEANRASTRILRLLRLVSACNQCNLEIFTWCLRLGVWIRIDSIKLSSEKNCPVHIIHLAKALPCGSLGKAYSLCGILAGQVRDAGNCCLLHPSNWL